MTEVLAQQDAYLKSFEATIAAVQQQEQGGESPPAIALDRTAFFPGSGTGWKRIPQGVLRNRERRYKGGSIGNVVTG
jgi:Ser-tRNA(Ala) deacylase AlaX